MLLVFTQFVLFFVLICILLTYYFYKRSRYDYVKSNIDGRYYYVRNLPDKQLTADELAKIRKNVFKLVEYMEKKTSEEHDEYKHYVDRLKQKVNDVIISENFSEHMYTSYSVNKGDKLVFCLRSRNSKSKNKIHDMNLVMYVVLHEISHIACPVYDFGTHGDEFKKIFSYFLKCAEEIGIYNTIDFQNNPKEYCGITINNS